MNHQLLLLEDVEALGRSGDLVKVKSGFARNFLLPQKKAVVATKQALRIQEQLKEERAKKAIEDKKKSEILAASLQGKVIVTQVKVDQEGHMYGSVSASDIAELLQKEGIEVTRRQVLLHHPIKVVGVHEIPLKLPEGVPAQVTLQIEAQQEEIL